MDEQLHDRCPMPLVGRDSEVELDGPDNVGIHPCDQDAPGSSPQARQDVLAPEQAGFLEREGNDEAHARPAVDDGVKDLAERADIRLERPGISRRLPLFDMQTDQSAHGRTIAIKYRASRLPVA